MLPPIVRPVPATQPEVPTGTFIVRGDAVSEKIFVAASMTVLGTDKLTVASSSHRSNALSPMLVALLGMVMLVRLSHSRNAKVPMLVTLLGMVMLVRSVQPANAEIPMLVTLLGMVMLVRLVQTTNVLFPMLVKLTLVGRVMLVRLHRQRMRDPRCWRRCWEW